MESLLVKYLVAAIGGLISAIVYLVLWIRKLNNKNITMAEKFSDIASGLKHSMEMNTKATESNTQLLNDLHKYMLTFGR